MTRSARSALPAVAGVAIAAIGPRWRSLARGLLLLAMIVAAAAAQAARTDELGVTATTTNARAGALGVDSGAISFGWTLAASVRGARQQAYQVRVGTAPGRDDVWDSGKVASDRQVDVRLPAAIVLQPATRYHWQVRAWNGQGRAGPWSTPAWFETGLLSPADWRGAHWIAAPFDAADQPRPLLRRTLHLGRPVRQARLYATARGVYQLWLNGRLVGDQSLAPGWTDYRQRLQVQTYDVTELLRDGANTIGAALADGWFRGKVGMGWQAVYGTQLALKATLRVTYADGSTQDFGTDAHWRSLPGPWLRADLQDGEHYDARRLPEGWAEPGFDDAAWQPVSRAADTEARLVPQPDEPVRATELRPAQARLPAPDGVYVYDVGQNLVGVARVKLTGRAGQTVRLRHAEELYRRGDRQGQLYTDNLRGAAATDTYTFARDETVTWQPRFTQHGFRYLEITGIDAAPAPADVQAVVLGSDLPAIGDLRLSNPMLDQLVRNIRWGQRGNFLSIPTDTPARDERLGWTGDINVFAPTASRLADTRAFLSKWMDDVADAQRADGNIPAVVPYPGRQFAETGVGWSDAFITVPYAVWRASGDIGIVRRHWAAMLRFHAFVHASATADGNLLEEGRASWFSGDWLSLEGVDRLREHAVIATAYFAEDTRMMAEMAAALGDVQRARAGQALYGRIRRAFAQAYLHADGSVEPGTQTAYAMALGMGLLAPGAGRDAAAARFVEKLAADDHHLKTGFLGTPWLLPALSSIGRDDLAMRLLLNEDYPSWGHEIRMGATTVWERWNSIDAEGAFGPVDMNSFNHYANGAVGDWMFRHLGGLQMLEPGYRRSRIAPLTSHPALRHAKASLRTPYGLLASEWRCAAGGLHLDVDVPVGTEAEIVLPAPAPAGVREGQHAASRAPGVRRAHWREGVLTLRVGSGHYALRVPSTAGSRACPDGPDRAQGPGGAELVPATLPPDEDGSRLWLRYPKVSLPGRLAEYRSALNHVVRAGPSPTLQAAQAELLTGLGGLLEAPVPIADRPTGDGAVVLGTPASSALVRELALEGRLAAAGREGYVVEATVIGGFKTIVVAANTDVGVLHGSFALLRHLQMQRTVAGLALSGAPKIEHRLLDHWDNLDGSVERGYAGRSLWDWNSLPAALSPRYTDYARANASLGINGAVLNNVNADAQILTAAWLDKVAALANVFRPYGIRVYLSARFSAPMEIGGLASADPMRPEVRAWWADKVAEIYRRIPDFGGFLVKANSEGQPGPQTYRRSHADGARMLSDALGAHGGVVLWRAFVYADDGKDRVRQAYDEFKPLDGQMGANTLLQVKNGPLDFQPREPFSPLFGAMPRTPLALELQITKEYLGADTHLAYLGTLFEEVLKSDTGAKGRGSTVARVVDGTLHGYARTAIAGVANIGSDPRWTGSHFNQANWYAFGRLAWDPDASARDVADEWVRQTFGNAPEVVGPVTAMMMGSRQTLVNYMVPLGLVHLMGTDHHYGPAPWVSTLGTASWNPAYYHRADRGGIGFDRTAARGGSGALAQYAPDVRERFANRATVGDDLLLFFHRVRWNDTLASTGRTVWHELVHRYSAGVDGVQAMRDSWRKVQGRVDTRRFDEVAEFLRIQHHEARWWRDASLQYFASVSGKPLPPGYAAPAHELRWYQDLARRCPADATRPRCPDVDTGDPSPAVLGRRAERAKTPWATPARALP